MQPEEFPPAASTPAPQLRVPAQLHAQINVQAVPPTVWDRLEPSKASELAMEIVHVQSSAEQHRVGLEQARLDDEGRRYRWSVVAGSLIALTGLGVVALLAVQGQKEVASAIGASLTTLVSVLVGMRLRR